MCSIPLSIADNHVCSCKSQVIKEKVIFTAGSVAVIAAAIQCGAKIISYDDMIKLISDDEI